VKTIGGRSIEGCKIDDDRADTLYCQQYEMSVKIPSQNSAEPVDDTGRPIRELHGVTLQQIVEYLEQQLGFARLADHVPVKCFSINPSIKSSLIFLRRTPWARKQVEDSYIEVRSDEIRNR
jgi:hypothetical protein